ncbi:hypothetical protein PanWU01x14_269370 [Parasponia andersonii]|uniref:Uncharacterized protein n=1 Tax=Parasponia andersonii TaxID=3476 RepID=A0A2P5B5D7_PARAD|nr:hypothetical protein PanWU01x14_269370 [Parasponia andersonii]
MASLDPDIAKTQEERKKMEQRLDSLNSLTFDTDVYGGNDKDTYVSSIPVTDDDDNSTPWIMKLRASWRLTLPPKDLYRLRRLNRLISPDRNDPFAPGEKTPDPSVRIYAVAMREAALKREEETPTLIAKKKKEEEEAAKAAAEKGETGHGCCGCPTEEEE